jgi:uncharacterized OB-fold protein
MIEGALLPQVDHITRPFWEGTAVGELRMQTCGECGVMRFPPRPMCPRCQSLEVRWQAVSGRGEIWSFVVPHPPLLPAFMAVAPYNVIIVALEEDPELRMVGNLLASPDGEINEIDPATIRIGEPVEVVFQHVGEDVTLPRWVRR